MSHTDTYRQNEDYAEFLASWDPAFFGKYVDTLGGNAGPSRLLDVGCGVGQVVKALRDRGHAAEGVDVSEPNIRKAQEHVGHCQIYEGKQLPFPDDHFDGVGAFNVLEHVEEPEDFLRELVRVLKPQGRAVVSSPNFLRVLGFRDYHPRMRGLGQKLRNARTLLDIRRTIRQTPESVRFERMPPIVKEPFTPDDDAIVATNPFHMRFFLERAGCDVQRVECTDRHVASFIDWALNFTPIRFLWFNSFVVATKTGAKD